MGQDGHPDGPKMGPYHPRWLQNGSISTDGPSMVPKLAQHMPSMVPHGPTMGPDAPKMGPRWTENGSKMDPEGSFGIILRILAPSGRHLDPSGTQNGSIWPQHVDFSWVFDVFSTSASNSTKLTGLNHLWPKLAQHPPRVRSWQPKMGQNWL